MTKSLMAICALLIANASVHAEGDQQPVPLTPLPWAYALTNPGIEQSLHDEAPVRVPGSERTFLLSETRNLYSAPDWHPDDHPQMPAIVAQGRNPGVYACGYCHLPNGQGRPENASLAGLPAEYIVQQMADYKAGLRRSSEPQLRPAALMLAIGAIATDQEIAEAAAYFASLTPRAWIRVIETETVPETTVAGSMYITVENGGVEPIGQRIIEMPEDLERTELRDFRSGFIAYVPIGSIEQGEWLVRSGGDGKTQPCGTCHGEDLRGLGPVPRLAGRSPSYVVRQLYDLQNGARRGQWSALMQASVAQLSQGDLVAIAAYIASLDP